MDSRILPLLGLLGLLSFQSASARTWINSTGQPIKGSFLELRNGSVRIRLDDDRKAVNVPLKILSKADQEFVRKRTMTGKADLVALAVKRIDAAVDAGLEKQKLKYNENLNDHMYLRRIYLDLAGRIPNYDEAREFLNSRDRNKRQELVIKLLRSWDYASHNYNYLAELLRIQTTFPGTVLRNDAFIHWLKEQIHTNTPWNELVREMVTAEGRIWDNPAVGYHLRDNGMKLDHVAFMGKVFLGTNITCAQCHDDPFSDWTQYQYYEFSAYLADLETKGKSQKAKMPKKKELEAYIAATQKLDPGNEEQKRKINNIVGRYQRSLQDMSRASELAVHTVTDRSMRLPSNYQYEDGFPRDKVKPWVLFGKENGTAAAALNPRQRLAVWLTSAKNERFAMNIANRMWTRYMGRGAVEPLHDINPKDTLNADLLKVLTEEMVALDFDLKAFAWSIVNTKAYNRLATRRKVNVTEPYYFPGPLLRRMNSEQVWDSLITLMVEDPNQFRLDSGDRYNRLINASQSPGSPKQFVARVDEYNQFKPEQNLVNAKGISIMNAKPPKGEKPFGQNALSRKTTGPTDEEMMMAFMDAARKRKLLLARASELPQPSDPAHFLSKFGQSDRNFVINASTLGGSVPQVMELMNGYATEILTQPGSRIFLEMKNLRSNFEKADVVFMSILSRRAIGSEQHLLDRELRTGGPEVFSDLIWALLNTPEFLFIK
ncbi:MAG: DUF1549 domain-containing protein [Roseibacillus sp.]|jgi:hypothetical protein|nr:DUF1549 domain-containing protein [Roseibacillus sp.]MDP7307873.1 DUF1549 domain-containing protein [Roseibacillus sp.]